MRWGRTLRGGGNRGDFCIYCPLLGCFGVIWWSFRPRFGASMGVVYAGLSLVFVGNRIAWRCFKLPFCGTDYANGADACASPPPCECGFAAHRRLNAVSGILPLLYLSASCLGSSVVRYGILPARSPSSRRPVYARSLWCGLRSSCLVTPPSRRSVATTRLHATPLFLTYGNVIQ